MCQCLKLCALQYTSQTKKEKKKKILRSPRTASVACRRGLWMMQLNMWHSFLHLLRVILISAYLTSWPQMTFDLDLWPFDHMNIWRFPYYINKLQVWLKSDFNLSNEAIFTFSTDLTTWPQMTFDLGIWLLTAWTYEGSHIIGPINWSLVPIGLQLFKWGHFHIFSLSYNLTSDDLWPWYVTFNFISKWGFPYCIYDPTLVKIHHSMWKVVEPNVNLYSHQQQTTNNNNSGQSDPYVLFLPRQATQKEGKMILFSFSIISTLGLNREIFLTYYFHYFIGRAYIH